MEMAILSTSVAVNQQDFFSARRDLELWPRLSQPSREYKGRDWLEKSMANFYISQFLISSFFVGFYKETDLLVKCEGKR